MGRRGPEPERGEKATERLSVRLTPGERAELERAALKCAQTSGQLGVTLASWARDVLLGAARKDAWKGNVPETRCPKTEQKDT